MSSRAFCNRCGAEVDDVGGFCLLGHRLSALAPPPPPPPPPATSDVARIEGSVTPAAPAPEAAEAAPSRYASSIERTWAELESAPAPAPDDPINTFAPPPRMDWGPQRSAFRLKLRRQRAELSV